MQRNIKFVLAVCVLAASAGCGGGVDNDNGGPPVKPSTATANVSLTLPVMDIPVLNRKRQIRLYLPPDYATSGKRYPVLYMHDAQNLFDEATGDDREWNVDETMNALSKAGQLDLIVVGIDHGGVKRATELNAWDNATYGPGEGRAYMDFIVQIVKPLMDRNYRTLPDRANTGIMGSSLGGLISHYALVQYPQVFGKAGVFSPSYWINSAQVFDYVAANPSPRDARIYMMAGDAESVAMVPDAQRMFALVKETGLPSTNVMLRVVAGGRHNDDLWSSQFKEAVLWMYAPN